MLIIIVVNSSGVYVGELYVVVEHKCHTSPPPHTHLAPSYCYWGIVIGESIFEELYLWKSLWKLQGRRADT